MQSRSLNSEKIAKQARLDVLDMLNRAHSSHIGSNFSIADVLAVLYIRFLNIDPQQPRMEDRDRFF